MPSTLPIHSSNLSSKNVCKWLYSVFKSGGLLIICSWTGYTYSCQVVIITSLLIVPWWLFLVKTTGSTLSVTLWYQKPSTSGRISFNAMALLQGHITGVSFSLAVWDTVVGGSVHPHLCLLWPPLVSRGRCILPHPSSPELWAFVTPGENVMKAVGLVGSMNGTCSGGLTWMSAWSSVKGCYTVPWHCKCRLIAERMEGHSFCEHHTELYSTWKMHTRWVFLCVQMLFSLRLSSIEEVHSMSCGDE